MVQLTKQFNFDENFLGQSELFAPRQHSNWATAAPPSKEELADTPLLLWTCIHHERPTMNAVNLKSK